MRDLAVAFIAAVCVVSLIIWCAKIMVAILYG